MNKYILIKVTNNIARFINKCNKYNIEIYDICYVNKNEIIVKIDKSNYKNIKIYNYYSDIEIYKKLGLDKIKEKVYNLKYFILIFILCLLCTYLISNIIININVIHSNKKIRELLKEELYNNGIKEYSFKKNFNELENIKNKILENNKDKIEWISITNVGMKYVIRVEERIIDNIKAEKKYCNLVSTKDAIVTNIYGIKGEILINVNDIVKKDDVLISGNILLNEENKGITCANGKVIGKVWYSTSISLKREYEKKEYTGNKRYNIEINKKILRNNKYKEFDKKYLLNTKYIKIYKELEYKNKKYKFNKSDGIEKALSEIDNKFKSKLNNNGKIIDKKILNQTLTNNLIELNVFVITEENIGKVIELDESYIENNA